MDLSKNKVTATLIFPVKKVGGKLKVLLAEKVRKIGVGCPNGFGGSLNKRETIRTCAARELRKESGLVVLKEDLEFVGIMTFHNQRDDGSKFTVRVFVFIATKFRGKMKLKEDEMINAKWYETRRLPHKKMMPADPYWIPLVLSGKKIKGKAWYCLRQKSMPKLPKIKIVKFLSDID